MTKLNTHKPMTTELPKEIETNQWTKQGFNEAVAALIRSAAELHTCRVEEINHISIRRCPDFEHKERIKAGKVDLNSSYSFDIKLETDVKIQLAVDNLGWSND